MEKRDGSHLTRAEEREQKRLKNEEEMKKYEYVSKANKLKKMNDAIFEKKCFGSLQDTYVITNKLHRSIDKETVNEIYALCKANMEDFYNSCSWKWIEKKESDIRSRFNRFIIIRTKDTNQIVAYIQIRFLVDPDDDNAVIYIYDIQVHKDHQGKGLGGRFMQTVEDLAKELHIPKCRLTVFKHNQKAFGMYEKKYHYKIDSNSPSMFGNEISFMYYMLYILNKMLAMKFSQKTLYNAYFK